MLLFPNIWSILIIYFILLYFLIFLLLIASLNHFILALLFLDLLVLVNVLLILVGNIILFNATSFVYALLLLAVGACDTAFGLGLCVVSYKATLNVSIID